MFWLSCGHNNQNDRKMDEKSKIYENIDKSRQDMDVNMDNE